MDDVLAESLALREYVRDRYAARRDPIADDRMGWRAHAFRQLVHLLPGERVLELGCGDGRFTRQLLRVSRGEVALTAVTFAASPPEVPGAEVLASASLPGPLAGRQFDLVVAHDMLDRLSCTEVLAQVYELLAPGGEVVFFQSNPWNAFLKARRALGGLVGRPDPRSLPSRPQLYELMSEVGFVRVFAVFTDFVYAPLTPRLIWLLKNLSTVLENAPGARSLAGALLVHAQKPPRSAERGAASLTEHAALSGAVSVVVPCYNEAMNVRPLVNQLRAHYDAYLHEVILVDDNSTDGTRAAIEALAAEDARVRLVARTPPGGVGRALADGLRAATGRYVLTMDADFLHLLPELRDLFDAAADGADVAIGSRFSRHSVLLNYPFQKIIANRAFHALGQVVLARRFRDLTNNLKLMRREVVEQLVLREPGFAANAETGLQPLLSGFDVREVPISWINRRPEQGASSFRVLRVGGGYARVLRRMLRWRWFGSGTYAELGPAQGARPRLPAEG